MDASFKKQQDMSITKDILYLYMFVLLQPIAPIAANAAMPRNFRTVTGAGMVMTKKVGPLNMLEA